MAKGQTSQQRNRVSSRDGMTTLCIWGEGRGWGEEGSGISADRLHKTDEVLALKRPHDSLYPPFTRLCKLVFVGLFDKSQCPQGQTLDLACSAGLAPGSVPVVWSALNKHC